MLAQVWFTCWNKLCGMRRLCLRNMYGEELIVKKGSYCHRWRLKTNVRVQ